MKVTYEVTAVVPPKFVEAFEEYMRHRHIADVLATGYFESATFSRTDGKYRMKYVARSSESLDQYLANDTMRLRDDFYKHFPDGIELSREIWDVIEAFEHSD
ncbi:MAG: DUF4286 family protein [Chloracidobacterium sp.]|nr:DUF4286 family protein [Chloracidobacterium sp.]